MKKVLFASTVLAAGALAAPQFASAQSVSAGNADITLGGYARWGLQYDDSAADEYFLEYRYRLQIDATATADNGAVFGARVRIQSDNGTPNVSDDGLNGPRFFVRAGGLEVGAGNIFGALESMPGQYTIDLGLTGLGYDYTAYDGNANAYSSAGVGEADTNGLEIIYSAGDFTVHIDASDTNDRVAGYAAYTFSGFTFALGAQDSDFSGDTEWTAAVEGSIGPATIGVAYADNGTNGTRTVLMGQVDVGASTDVGGYVAFQDDEPGATEDESFGVDFNHNLGGGVTVRGGIASLFSGATVADLGVRFNF